MATFDETPQVVFEVKDDNGVVVYRDAITYVDMAELRNDNAQERQAKFQARYQAHLDAIQYAQDHPEQPEES